MTRPRSTARFTAGSRHVPLLGRQGDEIMTIPFFAEPRVELGDGQHDHADRRPERPHDRPRQPRARRSSPTSAAGSTSTSPPTCASPARLIGIDAGQPAGRAVPGHGPAAVDPAARSQPPPVPASSSSTSTARRSRTAADPSTSDKLAQRNLTFVGVPNPGVVDSRVAPQTLQIRPTPAVAARRPARRADDRLGQRARPAPGASIYLPTVDAAAALDWAHTMYVSNRLALVDAHTLVAARPAA